MANLRIITLLLVLGTGQAMAAGDCSPGGVDLKGDWGQAHFSVEIADEPQEQAQGLMFRERLPSSAGMLFVYDRPQPVRFWMKNTLIPLDMLFLDQTGRVTRIHENARPLDETPIDGGDGVQLVLEINGGMARALGITEGSVMRHPVIDSATALWPCE